MDNKLFLKIGACGRQVFAAFNKDLPLPKISRRMRYDGDFSKISTLDLILRWFLKENVFEDYLSRYFLLKKAFLRSYGDFNKILNEDLSYQIILVFILVLGQK